MQFLYVFIYDYVPVFLYCLFKILRLFLLLFLLRFCTCFLACSFTIRQLFLYVFIYDYVHVFLNCLFKILRLFPLLVLIKVNAPKKTILIGPINPIRTDKNYFPFFCPRVRKHITFFALTKFRRSLYKIPIPILHSHIARCRLPSLQRIKHFFCSAQKQNRKQKNRAQTKPQTKKAAHKNATFFGGLDETSTEHLLFSHENISYKITHE